MVEDCVLLEPPFCVFVPLFVVVFVPLFDVFDITESEFSMGDGFCLGASSTLVIPWVSNVGVSVWPTWKISYKLTSRALKFDRIDVVTFIKVASKAIPRQLWMSDAIASVN